MTIEYPSPEMILAGEVTPGCRGKAVERTRAVKTPCRSNKAAGQERVRCVAENKERGEETYIVPAKRKTAELLQQSSGVPRFGKRRLHLQTV